MGFLKKNPFYWIRNGIFKVVFKSGICRKMLSNFNTWLFVVLAIETGSAKTSGKIWIYDFMGNFSTIPGLINAECGNEIVYIVHFSIYYVVYYCQTVVTRKMIRNVQSYLRLFYKWILMCGPLVQSFQEPPWTLTETYRNVKAQILLVDPAHTVGN